jgi:hypothetical protein
MNDKKQKDLGSLAKKTLISFLPTPPNLTVNFLPFHISTSNEI